MLMHVPYYSNKLCSAFEELSALLYSSKVGQRIILVHRSQHENMAPYRSGRRVDHSGKIMNGSLRRDSPWPRKRLRQFPSLV
jgi:hypothetical protein